MRVEQLALRDFRSYGEVKLDFEPGLVAITGENGRGKTNMLEAIGYLATLKSFRGAATDVMVRDGAEAGFVRGIGYRGERQLLIECELRAAGRGRVQVNKQKLTRRRDLAELLLVSVFAPDDLEIVKGGPSGRRAFLDDLIAATNPANAQVRDNFDKVLRQRNALLKGVRGRLDESAEVTLDVWDNKFTDLGERWANLRQETLEALRPTLQKAHLDLSASTDEVTATYVAPWRDAGLAASLTASRDDDVRRGVTTVGPHRDDIDLQLVGLSARNRASQGEQRTVSLALRLAAHQYLTELHEASPILLLDDVFSELDPNRSEALLEALPPGQIFVSTAVPLPDGAKPDQVVRIESGDTPSESVVVEAS